MPLTFVGNHDVTRIASRLTDERHLAHALVVLFTVGGHAGGLLRRRAGLPRRQGGPRGRGRRGPPRLPRPARTSSLPHGWPTYRLHQHLIGLRRRHPWLVRARTTSEHLTNLTVALTSTAGNDGAGNGEAGNGGVRNGGDESGRPRIVTLLEHRRRAVRFPVETKGLTIEETSATSHPGDPALVPAHGWTVLSGR